MQPSTFNSVGGASAPYCTKRAVLPRVLLKSAIQVAFGEVWECFVEFSVPARLTHEGTHNTSHGAFHSQRCKSGSIQHTRKTHNFPKACNKEPQAARTFNQTINYYHIYQNGSSKLMTMHRSSRTSSLVPCKVDIHKLQYLVLVRRFTGSSTVPNHSLTSL